MALALFEWTHELVPLPTGGAFWRMARLPGAGSVGEQDAWTWEALAIVRDEQAAQLRRGRQDDELAEWRQRKQREVDGG